MFQLLNQLYKANFIAPLGFFRLGTSILLSGINLMALLRFAARVYPSMPAIKDDDDELTYKELYLQTRQLATNLQEEYGIKRGKKVAILCRNHSPMVKALFALSRLGADVYLLNIEMNVGQFESLLEKHDFDLVIYDIEVFKLVHHSSFSKIAIFSTHLTLPAVEALSQKKSKKRIKLKRGGSGKLIILTGGTTGDFKTAVRKPSIFTFLSPFFALLTKLNLGAYRSVYIATPVYHGFGMAAVLISLVLGKKVLFLKKFHVNNAKLLILREQAQVAILVPLMLDRLLEDRHILELIYLRSVICGGAALNPTLVEKAQKKLGSKLANLYGTSEAGFSIMATPEDLESHPNTIGKKISGVQGRIFGDNNNILPVGGIGRLCIKSKWAMTNKQSAWVDTGDLAYVDEHGYYFLCGRIDDMIVSGGENVYPVELENILIKHEEISQVAVIGIPDKEFGQRLKAFVVLKKQSNLTEEAIRAWLKEYTARYQRPKLIEFLKEIPVTSLGKPDKKILKQSIEVV